MGRDRLGKTFPVARCAVSARIFPGASGDGRRHPTVTERTPLSQALGFLREQAGIAFCFDCLANAIGATTRDLAEPLRRVVPRTGSPIDLGRGRCSVCRSETEVARHTLH